MVSQKASPENTQEYKVLGIMSGTSLDGLDLAFCRFRLQKGTYTFAIEQASTIPYSVEWQERLSGLVNASGQELSQAHTDLGAYIGSEARKFMDTHHLQPELIASHGHTIFHQPQKGFSLQIGAGYPLMLASGCRVVNDFRSLDVALGGQGAPLVPIGDALLFGDYDFCLNLGGIANVSAAYQQQHIAYDICPANMVLNYLSRQKGLDYDEGGKLAAGGQLHNPLLQALNQLDYYQQPFPKSLGYEWVAAEIFPLLEKYELTPEDTLHTFCHHIAMQVHHALKPLVLKAPGASGQKSLLATGGGAFNTYLCELMQQALDPLGIKLVVPEKKLVEYKEALVFALLGVLRIRQENNCLASVTGASRDNCGGVVYNVF